MAMVRDTSKLMMTPCRYKAEQYLASQILVRAIISFNLRPLSSIPKVIIGSLSIILTYNYILLILPFKKESSYGSFTGKNN
jgi:hypothetical protein